MSDCIPWAASVATVTGAKWLFIDRGSFPSKYESEAGAPLCQAVMTLDFRLSSLGHCPPPRGPECPQHVSQQEEGPGRAWPEGSPAPSFIPHPTGQSLATGLGNVAFGLDSPVSS